MPDYRQVAAQDAARYGLGPWFVKQIEAESGFRPGARSGAGALGIAQFMPGTAAGMGIDPMNPLQALDGAARLMAGYMRKYKNPRLALAAYNAGAGNVDKYGGVPPFKETRDYIDRVLGAGGAGSANGGSFGSGPSFAASGTPQVPAQAQASPFAGRQQFGRQVIASLGQPDTHQRMMGLIGAVLGMHRAPEQAPAFAPLASQGAGGGPAFAPLASGRGGAPAPMSDPGGLVPSFAASLQPFLAATGATIGSGYRSVAQQSKLWQQALAKYGSVAEARKWVAPPGHSNHNKGLAVDLRFPTAASRAKAHQLAARFGLTFPLSNEDWHLEPIGARR